MSESVLEILTERCEPLMEGDDHGGQGHCGEVYDPETQWHRCPHNDRHGPDSISEDPPTSPPAKPWKYLNATLDPVHITSVPRSLIEALDYFSVVREWRKHPYDKPKFICTREPGSPEAEYRLLPFTYDHTDDTWSQSGV